jgi:hypothetical protein
MRFAYADPPYLGCGKLYADKHPEALTWDDPETHRRLIERLSDEWPDGWALSLHVPSLRVLLPMCPQDVRIATACKTFGQIRPTRVQWMWEPIIWRGGRPGERKPLVRDWLMYSNQHRGGYRPDGTLIGAKPRAFCRWIFDLLGAEPGDTLDDLFPGTGAVGAAWAEYIGERSPLPRLPLEAA